VGASSALTTRIGACFQVCCIWRTRMWPCQSPRTIAIGAVATMVSTCQGDTQATTSPALPSSPPGPYPPSCNTLTPCTQTMKSLLVGWCAGDACVQSRVRANRPGRPARVLTQQLWQCSERACPCYRTYAFSLVELHLCARRIHDRDRGVPAVPPARHTHRQVQ